MPVMAYPPVVGCAVAVVNCRVHLACSVMRRTVVHRQWCTSSCSPTAWLSVVRHSSLMMARGGDTTWMA
eukprot:12926150-Prorocentrum_lima.AAC.2